LAIHDINVGSVQLRWLPFLIVTLISRLVVLQKVASKYKAIWFEQLQQGGVAPPSIIIRLPSVLMFLLFCIIVKQKHVPCCHNMNPQKKITDEWASEYVISISFPFPAVSISKPQQKWANQWACSGVRVTNTCTPVNALCMYIYRI
jgi:hypothetical protein